MKSIVAVTGCPTGIAHTKMAAEALKKTAQLMDCGMKVETHGADGCQNELSAADIAAADVVIVASDIHVNLARFTHKPLCAASTSEAIMKTRALIERALAEVGSEEPVAKSVVQESVPVVEDKVYKLVGITSCPTGIAHTFMAAEALKKAAAAQHWEIKVETQGSVGAKNVLTDSDIAEADAVVIAADAFVDTSRFKGKRLYETGTKDALHHGVNVLKMALNAPKMGGEGLAEKVNSAKASRSSSRSGPYKHLMTGVSYMLPIVVAGGLLIALAFALGGINAGDNKGTLGWALMQIGGGTAFQLFVPVLSAFIAYSIASRPGITAGLIGGMLANTVGAGFLGGIISGFLAGYLTEGLNRALKLPKNLEGLKPVLILPLLTTLVVGLAMMYVIGPPVKFIMDAMTNWLSSMQDSSALMLGMLLGAMMAFDMGGPVNKAAYTFGVGLLASQVYQPMAAIMAAGMTPPLALGLAATFFKNRFTEEEQEASKAALVLGISFITEGAIPFAASDPLRVIPCLMAGSAVTGAISMVFKCGLLAPHGGVFVLAIPNAVQHLGMYVVAILAGTAVSVAALYAVKKPIQMK